MGRLELECVPGLVIDLGVLDHGEKVLELVAGPLLSERYGADVVVLGAKVPVPHVNLNSATKQRLQVNVQKFKLLVKVRVESFLFGARLKLLLVFFLQTGR